MLSMQAGGWWLRTASDPTLPSSTYVAVPSWKSPLTVAEGATTLTAPALSQATWQLVSMETRNVGSFALGTVRDCAGAAVHRAHVRAFDSRSGRELLIAGRGVVAYANAHGNTFDDDRTEIDGVYIAQFDTQDVGRIEAWGLRTVGGPEVLLGCETVELVATGGTMLVDIAPLAGDAPSECGAVPP
jgi:hypothetical protein